MLAMLGLIAFFESTWCMAKEQYNCNHQGTISGYLFHEYHLQLMEGDKLTAGLKNTKLDVIILMPISTTLSNGVPFEIKKSGEYTLRVLMPRVFARRKLQLDYQLSLSVDRLER